MKTANDDMFSCKDFKNTVSEYIDEELQEAQHKPFMAHADACDECHTLLKDLGKIRQRMLSFARPKVSQTFNESLRARMQAELDGTPMAGSFDEQPAGNYMQMRFLIPAAAVILCAALLIPMRNTLNQSTPDMVSGNETQLNEQSVAALAGAADAELNYVIDSVNQDRAETGVFLNEGAASVSERESGNIMLVSF